MSNDIAFQQKLVETDVLEKPFLWFTARVGVFRGLGVPYNFIGSIRKWLLKCYYAAVRIGRVTSIACPFGQTLVCPSRTGSKLENKKKLKKLKFMWIFHGMSNRCANFSSKGSKIKKTHKNGAQAYLAQTLV